MSPHSFTTELVMETINTMTCNPKFFTKTEDIAFRIWDSADDDTHHILSSCYGWKVDKDDVELLGWEPTDHGMQKWYARVTFTKAVTIPGLESPEITQEIQA